MSEARSNLRGMAALYEPAEAVTPTYQSRWLGEPATEVTSFLFPGLRFAIE